MYMGHDIANIGTKLTSWCSGLIIIRYIQDGTDLKGRPNLFTGNENSKTI